MSGKPEFSSVVSSTHAIQQRLTAEGNWQELNFQNPPEQHSIYSLIGRVAAEWALLEYALDRIIWALADLPSVKGACLTAQMMGAMPRFNAIKAQLTLRNQSDTAFATHLTRLEKLFNRTHEPQEKRNRIVHDVWLNDEPTNTTAQFRAWPRKQLQFGISDVDLTDIGNTITAIQKLSADVNKWYIDIIADAAASLRRQQQPPSSSPPGKGA